jgi:hypothetical protein
MGQQQVHIYIYLRIYNILQKYTYSIVQYIHMVYVLCNFIRISDSISEQHMYKHVGVLHMSVLGELILQRLYAAVAAIVKPLLLVLIASRALIDDGFASSRHACIDTQPKCAIVVSNHKGSRA